MPEGGEKGKGYVRGETRGRRERKKDRRWLPYTV